MPKSSNVRWHSWYISSLKSADQTTCTWQIHMHLWAYWSRKEPSENLSTHSGDATVREGKPQRVKPLPLPQYTRSECCVCICTHQSEWCSHQPLSFSVDHSFPERWQNTAPGPEQRNKSNMLYIQYHCPSQSYDKLVVLSTWTPPLLTSILHLYVWLPQLRCIIYELHLQAAHHCDGHCKQAKQTCTRESYMYSHYMYIQYQLACFYLYMQLAII